TPSSYSDLNAGTMTNGEHTIKVIANAANSSSVTIEKRVIVDNTPNIVITTPEPGEKIEGGFDIAGTVAFKDNPEGNEGTVFWYIDRHQRYYKSYEGTGISFSYNADSSYPDLNTANFSKGLHTVLVKGVAANNASISADSCFIIGCSDPDYALDYDGDGVVDCKDKCPTVYGDAEDGCEHEHTKSGKCPSDPNKCIDINKKEAKKHSEQGNPTSIYTGNKMESEVDFSIRSPFADAFFFKRFYNSRSEDGSAMGYGWTHNFNIRLVTESDYLVVVDETGFGRYFSQDPESGEIAAVFNERTSLAAGAGTYIWYREDGRIYTFDADTYQLLSIEDRIGNRQTLTYDAADPDLLAGVLDEASGRSFAFSYTNGLLASIRLFSGSVDGGVQVTYGHDDDGNLTAATFADGSGFVYEYNDIDNDPETVPYINNLTRKTDAAGHLLATWNYDDQDRCVMNVTGDGRGVTLDYDTTPDAVIVTDAYGDSKTYYLTTVGGHKRIAGVTGESGCPDCVDEPVRWEYDEHLNVVEKEHANGRIDQYADFDLRGNPGTVTEAADSAEEKAIAYTWHPVLNQPLTRTEQSVLGADTKVTTWDYDDDGNTTPNEAPGVLLRRLIEKGYTRNASGAVVPYENITTFDYNAKGQVTQVDGPLPGTGDATVCTYDPATGDLLSLTRPVSGTTVFSNYDAAGRPGRVTDPNLKSIGYAYDGRGRLSVMARLWDSAVTGFTYNIAGDLAAVLHPNGATFTFDYESVYGRLVRITDALGNSVAHAYDSQGNIIETGYYLPSETRTFRQRFDYQHPDRPGKLWKTIHPDDSFFEYDYDAAGNISRVTDPAGKITTYTHDLFNRPVSMVQPGAVTTTYVYDGQGNLVLVVDPESHGTQYVVDDLGRTVETISPDSGTTVYTYDAAGNLVSKTDANGIATTYTYDDEYRLTGIHYPDSAQDVTYTYDQGTNGKGRLTGMSDPSGDTVYAYDGKGDLITETRTIGGVVFTTSYTYDAAGTPTGMTYPDGRMVTYELDAAGRVNRVATTREGITRTLADNIRYMPFGPVSGLTYGNGTDLALNFDPLHRPVDISAGSLYSVGLTRDATGNVTAITDNLDAANNQTFGYDDLYRLTSATGVYGAIGYTYDNVGNRLTRTHDGLTDTYHYESGTNRLIEISGADPQSFTLDAAGNTTATGSKSLVYNQNNRLIQAAENSALPAEYTYNGNGRRVIKQTDEGTTVYHYDRFGNLIGESGSDGIFAAQYIYFNGLRLSAIGSALSFQTAVYVTTSKGRNLEGVSVYAFTEAGAYTGIRAVTNPDGRAVFDLSALADGGYKFRADYLGSQFWSEPIILPESTGTSIQIPEETATLQVTQGGVPREGVNVYLFNGAEAYLGLYQTSDENGNVSFDLPEGGTYKFRADVLGGRFFSETVTIVS
ncbi:MAG TPA: DUF6531 domain-containing protein, partial [Desulfobacterales bacterium]|nr:DUF6531 domain-containing protein [Desulfobacterales bacterium]